jgi:hypothetical protein
MTQPENDPQTADRSVTEGLIRDLYAIAAFYLAHPDHPRPHSMTLHHAADVAETERIAAEYGRNGQAYGDVPQTDHDLADCSMPINLLVSSRPHPDGRVL